MRLYKKAGARYFVGQAMHHDHFFNFPSKLNRFNSMKIGPGKDICGLWQAAAEKQGLPFGLTEHMAGSFVWSSVNKGADSYGPYAGVPYDGNDPEYRDFYLDNFYNDSVIKYHNDEAENLIDVMSEQTVGVAARFTPDELAAKVGDIIGGIEFYAPTSSDSCSVTLKIWQGGSIDDPPGELVFEKEVDDFEGNTWVGDYLHAPIEILADTEYWIGYIIHTINGKACWLDNSEIVENKGLWLKPSDAWIYPGANPDLANNLMIQMTTYSDYAIDEPAVPVESFVSSSIAPNPFTENTKISFSLKPENNITNLDVMIFNIKGQLIKSLPADINQNSGSVIWDGTNKENNFMPSGVYLYRLWNRPEAKFLKPNGKILLIK